MQNNWSTLIEKLGWRVLMLFMIALLLSQAFMGYQHFRAHLMNAKMTKPAMQTSAPLAGKITLRLAEGQHLSSPATVRINGEPIGRFSGQSYAVLVVNGDVITIDTSNSDSIYNFIVDSNDTAFTAPLAGEEHESSALHQAVIGPVLLYKN